MAASCETEKGRKTGCETSPASEAESFISSQCGFLGYRTGFTSGAHVPYPEPGEREGTQRKVTNLGFRTVSWSVTLDECGGSLFLRNAVWMQAGDVAKLSIRHLSWKEEGDRHNH